MNCPSCNKIISDADKFCGSCGQTVQAIPVDATYLKKWSWGAAFLQFVWAFQSKLPWYLALVFTIPYILDRATWEVSAFSPEWLILMAIISTCFILLGIYGRRLAWKKGRI